MSVEGNGISWAVWEFKYSEYNSNSGRYLGSYPTKIQAKWVAAENAGRWGKLTLLENEVSARYIVENEHEDIEALVLLKIKMPLQCALI